MQQSFLFRRSLSIGSCSLSLLLVCAQVVAATSFKVNGKPAQDGEISAAVNANGDVWLVLTAEEFDETTTFEMELTPFRNSRGNASTIGFAAAASTGDAPPTTRVADAGKRQVLQLNASRLAPGDHYNGELLISAKDGTPEVFSLTLTTAETVYQIVGGGANEVNIKVPSEGLASFYFDTVGDSAIGGEATFSLGPFTNETDGRRATVIFPDASTGAENTETTELLEARKTLLTIDASGIAFGATYTGEFNIAIDGVQQPPVRLKLMRIARDKTATLQVGQPPSLQVTCLRWTCVPDPIEVDLREVTGERTIFGLGLSTVSGDQNKGGLNPITDLSIDLNRVGESGVEAAACTADRKADINGGLKGGQRRPMVDLWRRNLEADASLPAGSNATLCIRFVRQLKPGEYEIPLRVTALNINPDAAVILILKISVMRSQAFPFAMLIFSVLLSYGMTKVIRTQLQRAAIAKRIARIRHESWFRKEWQLLPLVQIKATLSQVARAIDFSRWTKYLFFPSHLMEDVTHSENRLLHLKRLCALTSFWDQSNEDQLVVDRAKKEIDKVIDVLTATPLEKEVDASVATQLSKLEEWRDPVKLNGHYWLSLYGDILTIRRRIRWSAFHTIDFGAHINLLNQYPATPEVLDLFDTAKKEVNRFRKVLGQVSDPVDAVITAAEATLAKLHSSYASILGDSFQTLRGLLDAINDAGPDPAITEIANVRRSIDLDALKAEFLDVANLHDVLTDESIPVTEASRALLVALAKLDIYEDVRMRKLFEDLADDLEEQRGTDREALRLLNACLRTDDLPKNVTEALERELNYRKLKLIVTAPREIQAPLIESQKRHAALDQMFDIMDDWAWERLQGGISLRTSEKKPGAFELIEFSVVAHHDAAGNSYLYKHGLSYRWSIWYDGKAASTAAPGHHAPNLEVVTDRPRVTQYIPQVAAGPKISVEIRYNNDETPLVAQLEPGSLSVSKPKIFGMVAAFQRVELAALALAIIAALGTGMQSQQYQAAIGGSLSAYWALFAWGFAADQVKNMMEHIKTLTNPSG